MGSSGAGDGCGCGVATSTLRAASLVLVFAALQVSGMGQCFQLDGQRLPANLAEALRVSGAQLQPGGDVGGSGGGGGGSGLRLWLHAGPGASTAPPPPDGKPLAARVGCTTLSLHPARNVLEVAEFPSDLEVGGRDGSPMDNAVDSDNSVSMREAPIQQNTISRDLQLTEDKSHLPDHVVLSVNQWTPQAATMVPQFLVIVRTQSGLACEVKPPSSVDDARKLLSHISALDARHTISEVIVVNSDPESVVGSRQGETGWLRLLRTLLPPPQPPPPLANHWSEQSPRHPPPVQLRACLSHPRLQAANMPAYWKEVFAIITAAIPHRLAGRVSSPDGSADDQPREQQPPTGLSSAGLSPSLFHHRARRSLDDRPRSPVSKYKRSEYSVPTQVLLHVEVYNNYQLPPPSQVIVDNIPVKVTQLPPNWPFHPGASPPPRYVWTENIWEEVLYENGKWDAITPRRPPNPPSHTQKRPQPLYVFVDDVWLLLTSVDIIWDGKVNSFHPPQKLLQYQPNSSPTYVWIENKWVQIVNINNQWIATAPAQVNNKPLGSENKEQIVFVWDTKNWVLCKLSDLFPITNRPPQYQSDHLQKPGGPESGNKRPLDGSHNQSSYPGKQGEQTEKHRIQPFPPPHVSQSQKGAPSGIPVSGNSCRINGSNNKGQKSPPGEGGKQPKLAFPVPFGSYSKKPVHNTVKQLEETLSAGPYSGNNCPSDGSYNQSHLPPPGKGGKHKEKHPDRLTNANSGNDFPKFTFPPPFGSYNLKPVNKPLRPIEKTPTGVQNSINMNPSDGSHNHRQILPPGNQGEQRKNHRIHPFPPPHGSLSQKGTPPGGPNCANSCHCKGSNNKGQKSPTGRGEKQPKKGRKSLPWKGGKQTVKHPLPLLNESHNQKRKPQGDQKHKGSQKLSTGNNFRELNFGKPFGSYEI